MAHGAPAMRRTRSTIVATIARTSPPIGPSSRTAGGAPERDVELAAPHPGEGAQGAHVDHRHDRVGDEPGQCGGGDLGDEAGEPQRHHHDDHRAHQPGHLRATAGGLGRGAARRAGADRHARGDRPGDVRDAHRHQLAVGLERVVVAAGRRSSRPARPRRSTSAAIATATPNRSTQVPKPRVGNDRAGQPGRDLAEHRHPVGLEQVHRATDQDECDQRTRQLRARTATAAAAARSSTRPPRRSRPRRPGSTGRSRRRR